MITHVVMFKLEARDDSIAQEIHDRLMTLPDRITEIRHYEVGLNMIEADRNYDVVLISKFDDLDALSRYNQHPDHQAVVQYILSVTSNIIAVDFPS
jgi:hypothetical protein